MTAARLRRTHADLSSAQRDLAVRGDIFEGMLAIKVLGQLELELHGRRIDAPGRQSGRLLLGYLALRPGMHARVDLAALLWPSVLESSARVSLRSAIAAVRRSLGADAERYLLAAGDAIGLGDVEAGVVVDAQEFERLAAEGHAEAALELVRGPLLQGLDAEWVRQARAEHLDRVSDLLGQLAQRAEQDGSLEEAIRYTRRQVAHSPLAEPPNRELIRRLTVTGDRASALAVYRELAERFRRELQTVPSEATRQVAEAARSGGAAGLPRLPLPPLLKNLLGEPFVNRGYELGILLEGLQCAARGLQAAQVSGEPGVGKSALIARLTAAAQSTATVLHGRCRRPASAALEPFVEALQHYLANAPVEQLRLPPVSSELAALVPGIGDYLNTRPADADLLPDGARISRAMVETLASLARDRPLLLVLEDLHHADQATAELLGRLLSISQRTPLFVVVSFRDTELNRSTLLQRLSSQVRSLPHNIDIGLHGLDEEAVSVLARSLGHQEITSEYAAGLQARTNGNPFFVTHLLTSADPFGDSGLPPRASDLVGQELERLSTDTRACLSVAAVAGDEFDLGSVAAVAGLQEERALDALDEAVLAKVLVELPSGVGRYQFRHQLLREGIRERMTATRAAHLHRRLGEALIDRHQEGRAQSLLSAVEHLREARDLVAPEDLAGWLMKAAEEAEYQRTFPQAADFYAEFLEILGSRSPDRRARTLISLGHAARRAGQLERARSALIEANALAAELDDEGLQVQATLGLCALPFVPGDRAPDRELIAILERALGLELASAPALRAQFLARLASEGFYEPGRARPDDLAEEAVACARASADPHALAAAVSVSHVAFRGARGPEQRLELARELGLRARETSHPEAVVSALIHQTVDQVELGELEALEANAATLMALADELRQPAIRWWSELWRAAQAIAAGDVEEGAAQIERAYVTGHVSFGASAELERSAQLAWIALEQGRFDQLAERLPTLEDSFAVLPVWNSLKARVLIATGDRDQAAETVAKLTAVGLAALERDTNWLISATLLAETVALGGDTHGAGELIEALAPRADHWAISARGTVCLGPIAAPLTLLSAATGNREAAEHYFRAARERCVTAGAKLAAGRLERQYRACQTRRMTTPR